MAGLGGTGGGGSGCAGGGDAHAFLFETAFFSPGNYTNRKGGDDKALRHATAHLAPSTGLPSMEIAGRWVVFNPGGLLLFKTCSGQRPRLSSQ